MFSVSQETLLHRTQSAFPVSIATSHALESLTEGPHPTYDPERVLPPKVHVVDYEVFYLNVSTLYRNILGAVPSAAQAALMLGDLLDTLLEEMETIRDVVQTASSKKLRVQYYRSRYEELAKHHPHAKLKVLTTDKQRSDAAIQRTVLDKLFQHHTKDFGLEDFKRKLLAPQREKALILTHYAYDLLSADQFQTLDLLESHTGVLKKKSAFYTKLKDSKELVRIPFNALALQVFGDSQTFNALGRDLRQKVIDLSNEYEWTALTTKERQRLCFGFMADQDSAKILKSMLNE